MAKYEHPETDFPEAYKLCKLFNLTQENLITIRNGMTKEIINGLGRESHARSSIRCFLSYVQNLPTGQERGRFLALEMWPTNGRIMLVKFSSEKDIYMSSKCVIVPHTVAGARGTQLFDFLADNIAIFVKEKKVEKENLPMGIAFAFALNKLALDVGMLVAWTKGYGAQGVVGKDVVQLLRNSLAKHKDISVNLAGIINISAGSLMALCWSHVNTKIGLIIGTVTNAAYVELSSQCERYEGSPELPLMIINTEWAQFGANGHLDFMRNEFDKLVDEDSTVPGQKYFEKCISTLYLGELVRLIVVRLMDMGVMFTDYNQDYIGIHWKMEMKSLIAIVSDPPGVYVHGQEVMDKFKLRNCQERDLAMLKYICQVVCDRSAKLVAAGLAALINRMNYSQISISVDGGIYRLFPRYQEVLNRHTQQLANPHNKFEIVVAEDSPGVGAAIMAGLAVSLAQDK
ncbi:hexokinase type 1 [Drosophila sulfurigaster albostrigata]|uniref:hexokinase type 1 n=1 Tax=Drosophila sulfurigaster albostrigata TaxID=89887 RepID=UPI002D21C285|nr:hexokinase type 1 [Drosophila sulfurigaster albostrigata]